VTIRTLGITLQSLWISIKPLKEKNGPTVATGLMKRKSTALGTGLPVTKMMKKKRAKSA